MAGLRGRVEKLEGRPKLYAVSSSAKASPSHSPGLEDYFYAREQRWRLGRQNCEPEAWEIESYIHDLEDVEGNAMLDEYFAELEEHREKTGATSVRIYNEHDRNEDEWFLNKMLPRLREVRLSEYARERLDGQEEGAHLRLQNHWKKFQSSIAAEGRRNEWSI